MISIYDLKPGDVVITGDSLGYDKVTIVKGLHHHDDYPFPVVTIRYETGLETEIGGVKGYEPAFYPC